MYVAWYLPLIARSLDPGPSISSLEETSIVITNFPDVEVWR